MIHMKSSLLKRVVLTAALCSLGTGAAVAQTAEDLRLTIGKSVVIDYPSDVRQISTSNPDILDASPVTTREILLHAKGLGSATMVVWAKTNAGMGSFYRSQHELILVFKNGRAPHVNTFELGQHGRYRTNLWTYPGANSLQQGRAEQLALHPTVKPVAMIADAIKDVSRRGGIVLDLFGGSGSTLIAAHKTGRRARVCELDPIYCDRILHRWEIFAKDDAELIARGLGTERTASDRARGALVSSGAAGEVTTTVSPLAAPHLGDGRASHASRARQLGTPAG
jgi:hypothetical protein